MPSEEEHIPNISRTTADVLRPAASGLTNRDIADSTGIPYETVKKRLQRFCEANELNDHSVRLWAREHLECCLTIP